MGRNWKIKIYFYKIPLDFFDAMSVGREYCHWKNTLNIYEVHIRFWLALCMTEEVIYMTFYAGPNPKTRELSHR